MSKQRPRVVALALISRPGTREILVSNSRDKVTDVRFQRPFGGGVDFGERGEDALRRELFEELAVELGMVRLIGVVESLFLFEGLARHEISLLYRTEFADPSLYAREVFEGIEAEPKFGVWRDLDGEVKVPLYPPGLADHVAAWEG
jgi:8-oxo-dGTP pyrophosphatase MutT (NUDIX family)